MSALLEKIGVYRGRKEPSVIVIGTTADDFDNACNFIDKFCANEIRLGLNVLCIDREGRQSLALRFPKAGIVAPPFGGQLAASALLSTLKTRVIVGVGKLPNGFAEAVSKRAIPLIAGNEISDQPVMELINKIIHLAGQERKWDERNNRLIGRFLAEQIHQKVQRKNGRVGLGGNITRIDDIETLQRRLGKPETIMCLGNGPSSEDTRLNEMRPDALFRANHVWMKRNRFNRPDMVFTGMQASMKKIRNAVICVLGDTTEKVLLMVRARNYLFGKLEYCVAGGSSKLVELNRHESFRPTSGAVMLCVAVALKPQKLIVAGMDMFRHPDGAYPGDQTTSNAYTATHDHDHELAFILTQLNRFQGELVIVSEVLQAEWDGHQKKVNKQD